MRGCRVRVGRAEIFGREQSRGEVGGIVMNEEHLTIASIRRSIFARIWPLSNAWPRLGGAKVTMSKLSLYS